MESNPYAIYYRNQAGNGLSAFEGIQYQRGHGFFGDAVKFLYSNILKPIGQYLLPKAVSTGTRIGSDYLKGEKISDTVKRNIKRTAQEMADDGHDRVAKFIQTGKGRKRKRRRKSRKSIPLKRKTKSRKISKRKRKMNRKPKRKRKSTKRKINYNNFKNFFK